MAVAQSPISGQLAVYLGADQNLWAVNPADGTTYRIMSTTAQSVYARGEGSSNPNMIDHAMYADQAGGAGGIAGPPGPQGPQGPQGMPGPQGPTGPVEEAPLDGQLYSRGSGTWVPNLMQPNPDRVITLDALNPTTIAAGSQAFTLECISVNGTFVSGDQIFWHQTALLTWYITANQLQATILSDAVTTPGTYPVIVQGSDGVNSNQLNFIVTGSVMVKQETLSAPSGDSVSISCVPGGDLVATSVNGPNAGKSVNLTYGKWS